MDQPAPAPRLQSPKLTEFPKYPVITVVSLLAIAVTIAWWMKVDVSVLFESAQIQRGQLWRLLTSVLPHLDLLHLIFNLWWLWILGTTVERVFGHLKTVLLFLLFAIGPNAFQYGFSDSGAGLFYLQPVAPPFSASSHCAWWPDSYQRDLFMHFRSCDYASHKYAAPLRDSKVLMSFLQVDKIGPWGLASRFKDDWLVTQQSAKLFFACTIALIAFTPIFFGWINPNKLSAVSQSVWGVVGVAGPIAILFLWLGCGGIGQGLNDRVPV
jgi:Rhomboid family